MPRRTRKRRVTKTKDPSEDISKEIFEGIADDICEKLRMELDDEEFKIWKHNRAIVYVGVNDKRHTFAEVLDGECKVWSLNKSIDDRGEIHSQDYSIHSIDLSDPDFLDDVVQSIISKVIEHCRDIFIEYMKILNQLRLVKEEEESIFNRLNVPHYSDSSQSKSRLDDILRSKQYQQYIFEKMIHVSRHAGMVLEYYENLETK